MSREDLREVGSRPRAHLWVPSRRHVIGVDVGMLTTAATVSWSGLLHPDVRVAVSLCRGRFMEVAQQVIAEAEKRRGTVLVVIESPPPRWQAGVPTATLAAVLYDELHRLKIPVMLADQTWLRHQFGVPTGEKISDHLLGLHAKKSGLCIGDTREHQDERDSVMVTLAGWQVLDQVRGVEGAPPIKMGKPKRKKKKVEVPAE